MGGCEWLKVMPGKLREKMMEVARKTKKIGEDDPRRIIHSLKVGLAITLVSLFYYFEPLYNGFGGSAMWAVLTVVVVFDFSVGIYRQSNLRVICILIKVLNSLVPDGFILFGRSNTW